MNMCSDKHDEIVYEGRTCPLCEVLELLKHEEDEANRLSEEISKIEQCECQTCHQVRKLKE